MMMMISVLRRVETNIQCVYYHRVFGFLLGEFGMLSRRASFSATAELSCYPRDAMQARGNSDRKVSVCLSVTSRYCVKTKKASVMISSQSGSPMILVFWCQISSRHSKGFPWAGASNKGRVGKISSFLSLSAKTVANTAIVTIND